MSVMGAGNDSTIIVSEGALRGETPLAGVAAYLRNAQIDAQGAQSPLKIIFIPFKSISY